MKIGILTFHNGINAGTFLQAGGLCEQIEALGAEVSIIDYGNEHQIRLDREAIVGTKHPFKLLANLRKARKYATALTTLTLSPPVRTAAEINGLGYDVIVFGSDELWNIESTYGGGDLTFFGDGITGCRKVAYAPSFGSTSALGDHTGAIATLLKEFHALSARDENTRDLILSLTGKEVPLVVDPVLLSPPECPPIDPKLDLKGRIGAYLMAPSDDDARRALAFARRKKLPLTSVGYYHHWAHRKLGNLAPREVPLTLSSADLVITNTFHGCVFALKYRKPFVLIDQPSKTRKLDTLCKHFGLKRLGKDEEEVTDDHVNLLAEDDERLADLIASSRRYLSESLKEIL